METSKKFGRYLDQERINKLQKEILFIIETQKTLRHNISKNFNFAHSDKHETYNKDSKKCTKQRFKDSHSYTHVLNELNPNYVDENIAKYNDYEPEILEKEKNKTFIFIICKTINDIYQRLYIFQSDVANKDHSHEMSGFCNYYLIGSLHYKDKLM